MKTERLDIAGCSNVLQALRAILQQQQLEQQYLLATAMNTPSFLISLPEAMREELTVDPIATPSLLFF